MIEDVREISSVPVIASGGAGSIPDFSAAIKSGADAVLAASVFHFGEIKISDIKKDWRKEGIPVRQ